MKKILTLTDFSEVAGYATEAAIAFAAQHEASLVVLHVLDSKDMITYEMDSDPEVLMRKRNDQSINDSLDTIYAGAKLHNVHMKFVLRGGKLIEAIQDIIENEAVDLIVMGSTGGGQSVSTWGSTTQLVLRSVATPILIIKSQMRDYKMDDLLFVSDLDVEDQAVLTKGLMLLHPSSDAVVKLLSINTTSFFAQPSALMTSVLKDFEKLVAPYRADSTFYNDYSVDAGIRHFLEEGSPDVMIMSNRDRHPLKDFFVPSAAIKAVDNVQCPILIIK